MGSKKELQQLCIMNWLLGKTLDKNQTKRLEKKTNKPRLHGFLMSPKGG